MVRRSSDRDVLTAAILHEDAQVIVLNKPAGLAVQGFEAVIYLAPPTVALCPSLASSARTPASALK